MPTQLALVFFGILHVPLNVGEIMTSHQNTSDLCRFPLSV